MIVRRQHRHALRETTKGCSQDCHRVLVGATGRDAALGKEGPKLDLDVGPRCPLTLASQPRRASSYMIFTLLPDL